MGSWFTNIHIRKQDHITEETVVECIKKMMTERGFSSTLSAEEADTSIALYFGEGTRWVSIYSNSFAHDDPESCSGIITHFSSKLHTDVLGIACFDSDYLYLNLINAEEQVDAWVGIGQGKAVGIIRRNNLSVWKKKVSDFSLFYEKAKARYVVADEFLRETTSCLDLPVEQSTAAVADLENLSKEGKIIYLYFEQPLEDRDIAQLAHYKQGMPCLIGDENNVSAINMGAESKGLSIYFLGPYVENEEISFSNVQFSFQWNPVPVELTKVQLSDGQWAYRYHNPDFMIPPKVPRRIKAEKRARMEHDRRFSVRFTPCGNPRKTLDITVVFVPDANPEGQTAWNVWKPYGSKKAFIDHYNKIVKRVRAFDPGAEDQLPFLSEEDFD